jgi:hypothetical protein
VLQSTTTTQFTLSEEPSLHEERPLLGEEGLKAPRLSSVGLDLAEVRIDGGREQQVEAIRYLGRRDRHLLVARNRPTPGR